MNGSSGVRPYVLWPALSAAVFLLGGLVSAGRRWSLTSWPDKLIALAPVFFAAPLATFGAQHMTVAPFVAQSIPAWVPGRLFWAYFVGVALFAAATSFVVRRQLRLAATLLAVMFILFVVMMHAPNAAAKPGDRFAWAVALRDLAFAGGALAFAATQTDRWRAAGTSGLVTAGRLLVELPLLFFAIEHFLHPEFAPGVPLQKMTPPWFPAGVAWGYLTGVILLLAGAALLLDRHARAAAIGLGVWLLLLTLFLYVPILAVARESPAIVEGMNYVADTLLFAGTVLALAGAVRGGSGRAAATPAGPSRPSSPSRSSTQDGSTATIGE